MIQVGKHFRQRDPHLTDVLVVARDAADVNLHPHSERRFCFGNAMAEVDAKWHRPPSRTLMTKTSILSHFTHLSTVNDLSNNHTAAMADTVIYKFARE